MTKQEFAALSDKGILIMDGATGSNLAKKGMPRNVCVEAWIMDHPDDLIEIQKAYKEAGSDMVYAPTFGANELSLEKHGLTKADVVRLNKGLAEISRRAVGEDCLVIGDMTTTGELLEPIGEMEEDELFDIYRFQAEALQESGMVDAIGFETMLSLQETEIGLKAVQAVTDLPVFCTLTVQADGRALFGGTAVEAVQSLQELGASAVGINCSVGPDQMIEVTKNMKAVAKVPLIVKPNAGLPTISGSGEAIYDMTPDTFLQHMREIVKSGANIIGGCCGTTPDFIRVLKEFKTA